MQNMNVARATRLDDIKRPLRVVAIAIVMLSLCCTAWAGKLHRSEAKTDAANADSSGTPTKAELKALTGPAAQQAGSPAVPAAPAADSTPTPLVELIDKQDGGGHLGPLYHQIIRQAFLATARDEFNAETFDGALRENVPQELSDRAQSWEALSTFGPNRVNLDVTLNLVHSDNRELVWTKHLTIQRPMGEGLEKEVARAEQAIHQEFFDALRDHGLTPQPLKWRDDAPVPAEIQTLLDSLTLTSEFQAVRALHALIHSDGQSPQRLSALARAYANLGMLTEHMWTTSTKALTARALIYAEQLSAKQPDSAEAAWCRGYVLALAGSQHTALAAFEKARALSEKQHVPAPDWGTLALAYCRYDTKALNGNVDEHNVPLARWLYFLAVEPSEVPIFLGQVVNRVLEKCPDAYRAIDIMADQKNWEFRSQGAQYGQTASAQGVYSSLLALPEIPAAAKEICGRAKSLPDDATAEYRLRAELFSALRAAPADAVSRGEPGWSALATLLEDVAFVQTGRSLNAGSGSLDAMWPLVSDHPYAHLFKVRSQDEETRAGAIEDVKKLDPHGLTMNALRLLDPFYRIDVEELYLKPGRAIWGRADDTFHDRWVIFSKAAERFRTGALVDPLDHLAPNMPATVAGALTRQHDQAAAHVTQWERDYADNPDVLLALGQYYRDAGKTDDALRVLQLELKLCPDRQTYKLLAEAYLNQGDEDQWLATWDEYFKKVPDIGLDHAQSANAIALHFIKERRWDKAVPYADRAASSGASWGLTTSGECAEALGKWNDAQEEFSRDTRAYTNRAHAWYWFCRRTSYGNLDESRQVMEQFIAQADPRMIQRSLFPIAIYHALDHRFADAYKSLEEHVQHNAQSGFWLHLAILADQTKDEPKRDEWLRKVLTDGPMHFIDALNRPEIELISLAELISDDLAAGGKGQIDLTDAARRAASAPYGYRAQFYCLLGEYLEAHGQTAKAIECWKQAMLDPDIATGYRTVAGARLHERLVSPADYRQELQTPLAKAEPPPTPPKLRHPPDAAQFGGHYYKFIAADRESWSDAKQHAVYMGGQLATISTEPEQTFVAKLAGGKTAWLGGFREDGQWKWVSGEPFRYTHWFRRNIVQSYLRMLADGQWAGGRDVLGDAAGFVCRWEE
jgi:tetratricopeptide (TPR) repeat protein